MRSDLRERRVLRFGSRHPDLIAVIGYIVVASVVLFPALRPGRTTVPADVLTVVEPWETMAGGPSTQNPLVSDATFQFYPWWEFVARELRHGHVPQWNPGVLGGVPVTPNGYVSVYYPPFWLARFMSTFDAYDLFILLHLVLAASGVYALSRVVGARIGSAWLAGLGALVAAMWVHWSLHLVHLVGMTWVPMVLAAALVVVRKPRARSAALFAATLGLWWSGANPQYAYYGTICVAGVLALALGRAMVRNWRVGCRAAFGVTVGLGLGVLLAAPVLLPSARSTHDILRGREVVAAVSLTHLPGSERILAVLPDAAGNAVDHVTVPGATVGLDSPFIGITALVLASASLLARRRPAEWWLLAAMALLTIALGATAVAHPLLYRWLPGYDRFRQSSRWFAVLPAAALPLAALGWDRLRDGDLGVRIGLTLGAAGTLLACAVWHFHHRVAGTPFRYLQVRILLTVAVAAVVMFAGWSARRWPGAATGVVVACTLFEIAFHTPRWYPALEKSSAYPATTVARIAGARGGRIVRFANEHQPVPVYSSNVPLLDGVADAQGQAVLFPVRVDRYLRIIDDYGGYAHDQNIAPALVDPHQLDSPLLDALDVRTVVADRRTDVPPSESLIAAGRMSVYGRSSLGSAVLVPNADGVDEAEMWRRVGDRAWHPAATAAVVGLCRPVRGAPGTVLSTGSGSDHDDWLVDAPGGGFLRVSAGFARGWTATVDGKPTPVRLVDGMFRGVAVDRGRHRVRFVYRNPEERKGRSLALVGGAGVLACLLARRSGQDQELPSEQLPREGEP